MATSGTRDLLKAPAALKTLGMAMLIVSRTLNTTSKSPAFKYKLEAQ